MPVLAIETFTVPAVFTVMGSVQLVPLPVSVDPLTALPVPLVMVILEAVRLLTPSEKVKTRDTVLAVLSGATV